LRHRGYGSPPSRPPPRRRTARKYKAVAVDVHRTNYCSLAQNRNREDRVSLRRIDERLPEAAK
jgi:hypothetical protein